jgi:hypothetical protein
MTTSEVVYFASVLVAALVGVLLVWLLTEITK